MCKTLNLVIEIIVSPDGKSTYVIREIGMPNQPPKTLVVCNTGDEIAKFLDTYEIK